ncbi:hypothetical protein CDAR_464751 [Caerostris darwini]|uniref:Uncharacterized protein n=1 Tax=Caerostris darwini TaxID=1538125 RepID=A0AAV4RCE6_9ARAC|nr:hypothetical protein CDAR_464751 [Caerostris darwini]
MVKIFLGIVLGVLCLSSRGGILSTAQELFSSPSPCADNLGQSSTPPEVLIFLTVLGSALVTDKAFREVCDLSPATPKAFKNFVYGFTYKAAKDLGFEDLRADSFAKQTSSPLNCVEPLTTEKVFLIYFKSLAMFMSSAGVLNITNAVPLASDCLEVIDVLAEELVKEDCPQSKMKTLSAGFVVFVNKLGIYSPDTAPSIVFYFGEEAKRAKKLS